MAVKLDLSNRRLGTITAPVFPLRDRRDRRNSDFPPKRNSIHLRWRWKRPEQGMNWGKRINREEDGNPLFLLPPQIISIKEADLYLR